MEEVRPPPGARPNGDDVNPQAAPVLMFSSLVFAWIFGFFAICSAAETRGNDWRMWAGFALCALFLIAAGVWR